MFSASYQRYSKRAGDAGADGRVVEGFCARSGEKESVRNKASQRQDDAEKQL
jgi:hypothetical protein